MKILRSAFFILLSLFLSEQVISESISDFEQFRQAMKARDIEKFQELAEKLDVNATTPLGGKESILYEAAAVGDVRFIRILLRKGADVHAVDEYGQTALHKVAEVSHNIRSARALLAAGADVNAKDNNGRTPLLEALRAIAELDFITFLLAADADVNAIDNRGENAFHYAARGPSLEIVEKLLSVEGGEIEAVSTAGFGSTPLRDAILRAYDPMVIRAFLQAGAEMYIEDQHGRDIFDLISLNRNFQLSERHKIVLFSSGIKKDEWKELERELENPDSCF